MTHNLFIHLPANKRLVWYLAAEEYFAKNIHSLLQKYIGENTLKISLARPENLLQNAFSVAYAAYEIMSSEAFKKENYKGSSLSPIYLRLSQAERERNEKLKTENQGETK
jgi:hypothetical protein